MSGAVKAAAGAAVAAPIVLLLLLVIALTGSGAGGATIQVSNVDLTTTQLKPGTVPPWAIGPLQQAAHMCPEVSAPLLAAQIDAESAWNPHAHSNKGADGLAQFLPSTWAQYAIDGNHDGRTNPEDPADAIPTQAHYMCTLVGIVHAHHNLNGDLTDLALAMYNAGPGAVLKYNGVPPFPETTKYIATIRAKMTHYALQAPNQAPAGTAAAVIAAAHRWIGTPYAWGGGTLNGPSEGTSPDNGIIGFDCSGLVRYAVYQGTQGHITLPRTSSAQYAATSSHTIPVNQLQPGDLMFWGSTPASIHHVALYTGNHTMIEAPESGEKIHETPIRINKDYLGATRVLNSE